MSTDQHLNTGAMALGALSEDESTVFAEHVSTCPSCSAELASFLQTAAILGSSVAQAPPAGLRRSVMDAVSRTPQLPPLLDLAPVADPVPFADDGAPGRHRQTGVSDIGDRLDSGRAAEPDGELATVVQLPRPWYRRPQSLLAAAVAVLVIGGGTTVILANRTTAPPSASSCVAAAADRTVLTPTVGSGGEVTLSASCDAAVVKVPNLPAPPAGKVYQLWVMKGSNAAVAASAGVMKKNADGSFSTVVPSVHAGDSGVGVSLEPGPNGSKEPTTTPFWVVPFAT